MLFRSRKIKVKNIETIEFEYFYNDLTLEFLNAQRFDFHYSDLTKDIVNTNIPFDSDKMSEGKKSQFSGYKVLETKRLPPNRIEISHKNKPYNLDKVDFASFFNSQNPNSSFYDFETNNIEAHKRSICFLSLEYEDKSGTKTWEIRHFPRTVREFSRHEIENRLSKSSTDYLKKNPNILEKFQK